MRHITLEHLAEILEVMTIDQTINSGFAITYHGHVEGRPTIVISSWRESTGYIIQ